MMTMMPNRTRKWWEALWFVPTDWWITILKANFLSFYKIKLSNPLTFLYILRTMKIHNADSKRLRDFHSLNIVKYLHESGFCLICFGEIGHGRNILNSLWYMFEFIWKLIIPLSYLEYSVIQIPLNFLVRFCNLCRKTFFRGNDIY